VRARRAAVLLFALLTVLLLACAAPTTSPTPAASAAPTPGTSVSPGTSPAASPSPGASPGASLAPLPAAVTGCPLPQPLPTYPPGYPLAGQPLPHPLCPAQPNGADPISFLAWLFTPIFQILFMGLVAFYQLTGDIGIAIILLTIALKTLLIPLFRRQIVAQRRTQLLQPEIRSIQLKYKGNRTKISEETMKLYSERGVNPAAGCLPMVLQLFLLLPIYQVVSQGLAATEISSMLQVFGQPVLNVACQAPGTLEPCIDTSIWWLGGLEAHLKSVLFSVFGFEVSGLAVFAALLQLIQTRMMTPTSDDPQARAQQRILLVLPLLVLFWGFLPAGLFIYWIVFSAYSIVQQYFIAGWGSLFPLFGWTPGFAKDHTPRFAVDISPPKRPAGGSDREAAQTSRSPSDSAAGTIRPARQRGRTSRRGRRR
jgi:YidC/Oxa1 family membrane protein insertase